MKLVTKKLALALALVGSSFAVNSAMAATSNSTFNVTATVTASCSVVAANLSFGTFNPAQTASSITANTTITTTCTKTTPFTVGLSAGGSTAFAQRTMAGAKTGNTDKVNYNLYLDSAQTKVLGDGSTGTNTITGTSTGVAIVSTVYGAMPMQQFVTPDTYSDTITVTVTY